jgi:hypothetical protein
MGTDPPTKEMRKMKGRASITIRASREELAARWRGFQQDQRGPARLGPIEILGETPAGIQWRARPDAGTSVAGVTSFSEAPGERGCEVHVAADFGVPGGVVGEIVKKVTGEDPLQLVRDDLRRLKQLVEAGEIARSDGAPRGSSARDQPKQRPAQPAEHAHL